MMKKMVLLVVVGVLVLAVGAAVFAEVQGNGNEGVQTRTQTRTMEVTGECPEEPVRVSAQVQRRLGRGGNGKQQMRQMFEGVQ